MSSPVAEQAVDRPGDNDAIVAELSEGLGGRLGRRAVGFTWLNPARAVLLVATVTYLAGMVFRLPCRVVTAGQNVDVYRWMCYSDVPALYQARGLADGYIPYLDSGPFPALEYPVLTGWLLELERRLTAALGATVGPGLNTQQLVDAQLIFVDVNAVIMGIFFLIAVWAQLGSAIGRPWDAMLVAASPAVAAASLINWDWLVIALTSLGVLCWARRRPGWAGVFWGLGMAAKLYPLFLLGPLLFLCLRSSRMRAYATMLLGFAMAWVIPNLPVMILAPQGWLNFWTFNVKRGGDLGSIWYVLSLAGHPVPSVNTVSTALFLIMCAGIVALIMLAPRRPRIGAVFFLVMAAFLLTNKVYSPQYVLWLLPFVVLARPVWRDWVIFTVGELFYFGAIWWHLGGLLSPGSGGADRVYWLAVIARMAAEVWVAALVVRDALDPRHDVMRRGGLDDPSGGVLDGAADAGWWSRWRVGGAHAA